MRNSITFDYTDGKLSFDTEIEDPVAFKTLIFSIFSKKLNPVVFSALKKVLLDKNIPEINGVIPIIEDQNNAVIVKPSEFK